MIDFNAANPIGLQIPFEQNDKPEPNLGTENVSPARTKLSETLNNLHNNITLKSENPYALGKEVQFGAQANKHNFERYYNHNQFKNLGFSPFRDNESLYNENSSFLDEMSRASGQFGTLMSVGFKDAMSFGSKTDRHAAKIQEKAFNIGSSTMGGMAGFTTNFYLNSAYTMGLLAEMGVELAAEAGLMALTRGGSTASSLPAMGATITKTGLKLGKLGSMGANVYKAVSNLQDINKARQFFYKGLKAGGDFINPAENTIDFFRTINKTDASKNLSNLSKTVDGFASFYKDIRNIRYTYGESSLEGGSTQIALEEELLTKFKEKNGRAPNKEEAQEMAKTALLAGQTVTNHNLPIIFFSNKVVLDNMFKFGKRATTETIFKNTAGEVVLGKNGFAPLKGALQKTKHVITNPKVWAKSVGTYTKKNVMEGLQEVAQETVAGSAQDYYASETKGSYWSHVADNLTKQISPEGAEVFLSGFLMGGVMGPITKVPTYTKQVYTRFKDPTKYKEQKELKQQQLDKMTNILNDLYKDPTKYYNEDLQNSETQLELAKQIQTAIEANDVKTAKDLIDLALFEHVTTASKMGRTDTFIQRMEDMKNFTEEEAKASNPELSHAEFLNRLDKSIARAKRIESRSKLADEMFPSPFDPNGFTPGTAEYEQSMYNYKGFEQAKKDFVFFGEAFDRTLERMNTITQEAITDVNLKNMPASEFNILFSVEDSQGELDVLKKEIASLKLSTLTPESRRLLSAKEKKAEALLEYTEAMDDVITTLESLKDSTEEMDTSESYNKAYKAFENYLKVVATNNKDYLFSDNVKKAFDKLIDHYKLADDARDFNKSVNTLLNPNNLIKAAERYSEIRKREFEKRKETIEESLKKWMDVKENNDLLQLLHDEGIFFDPDQVEALFSRNLLPTNFYEMETKTDGSVGFKDEILKYSEKWNKAVRIINDFMTGIKNRPIPEQQDGDPRNSGKSDARNKINGDKRTYNALAKQFGFDPNSKETKVPLKNVLQAVVDSEFATKRERLLAARLLSIAKDDEFVLFKNDMGNPGIHSTDPKVQTAIDARYSAADFGNGGHPLEHVILHEEIHRRTVEALKDTNSDFYKELNNLYMIVLAYNESQIKKGLPPADFYGLSKLEEFASEAMSNDMFSSYLAKIPNPGKPTTNVWSEFMDAVVKLMKKILGGKVENTVLNASIDIIAKHIDSRYGPTTPLQDAKRKKEAIENKDKIMILPSTPFSVIENEHPVLMLDLLTAFKERNAELEASGLEPLVKDWELLSDEDLKKSLAFKNTFIKSMSGARKAIDKYNATTGRTLTEDTTKDSKATKEVAPKTQPTVTESAIEDEFVPGDYAKVMRLAQDSTLGILENTPENLQLLTNYPKLFEKYLAIEAKKAASKTDRSIWSRELSNQLSLLGYTKEEQDAMTVGTGWDIVDSGLTKEQQDDLEAAAEEAERMRADEISRGIHKQVIDLITNAKTIDELGNAEEAIFGIPNLWRTGMTSEIISELVANKKKELELNLNFADIAVGDIIMMQNGSKVRVYSKTAKQIVLESLSDSSKRFTVKKDDLNKKVKYRYSEAMEEMTIPEPITIEPAEIELSNKSIQTTQNLNTVESIKEDIQAAKAMAAEDLDNDLLNDINEC